MELLTIKDFALNPILKGLLVEYVLFQYNENADVSNEGLYAEYLHLEETNRLNDLFIQEKLNNYYQTLSV
jgi:hypothetical protein